MKNRTIYDVLDQVMENYTYTIEQTGNKVCLSGKVYIERIDTTVTNESIFYKTGDREDEYRLETAIKKFKEELRSKVAEVIRSHAEELTDDEEMIKKLQYEIITLKKVISQTEQELCDARQDLDEARAKIAQLELEKSITLPPYAPASPYTGTTSPWITWQTGTTEIPTEIGDKPGWWNDYTCSYDGSNLSKEEYIDYLKREIDKKIDEENLHNLLYGNKRKNGEER